MFKAYTGVAFIKKKKKKKRNDFTGLFVFEQANLKAY